MNSNPKLFRTLLIGDVIVHVIVTVIGFMTHDSLTTAGTRILTTFLPLIASWLLLGIPLGIFDLEFVEQPKALWRPFWAMLLAGPWIAFLRALMLQAPAIVPLFVIIMGGTAAIGLLTWRALLLLVIKKTSWMKTS